MDDQKADMKDVSTQRVNQPDLTPVVRSTAFRADIQGLRGLAIILVVLFHTNSTISGGFVGVDVFFVLSGFVITGLLLREARTYDTVRFGNFYSRRVRRLLPMLALTLTATALLGVFLLSPLGASATTAKTASGAAIFNANTFLARQHQDYFGLAPTANALLHTWSLSVEEQFYLVFPVVVLIGVALRRRSRRSSRRGEPGVAVGAFGVLALASFAVAGLLLSGRLDGVVQRLGFGSGSAVAFYGAPSRAWEFLVGSMVAASATSISRSPRRALEATGLLGLVMIVFAGVTFTDTSSLSATKMLLPVAGTAMVIAAGTGPVTASSRLLAGRPLVWLGDLSYGWYLLHWPFVVFAAANFSSRWVVFVAAVTSLAATVGTKHLVEDRFRYDNSFRGPRVVALAGVCILVPFLAGVLGVVASRALAIDDLTHANARHIDSEHCNRRLATAVPIAADECTWKVPGAKGRIVLIGDSHASMWSEAVIAAGNQLDYDVSVATMSGCPMVGGGVTRMRDGSPDMACRHFVERSLAELLDLKPSLVLFGSANNQLVTKGPEDGRWLRPDGSWIDGVEQWTKMVQTGLEDLAKPLEEAGVQTAIIHDAPYHSFSNAECSWLRYRLSPGSCASVRERSAVLAELDRSRSAETAAAAASGAATIDPVPWLCDARQCSTYGRGTWLYRDGDHISVAASESLAGEMKAALTAVGLG